MFDAKTDSRIERLAQTLADASLPLVRLFEYAHTLEKLIRAEEHIGATCVAAAIRAEAVRAQCELPAALTEVEQAVTAILS